MPLTDNTPWFVVKANIGSNPKLAELPNDSARWGWVAGVLAEAKRQRPSGRFTSRQHFRTAVPAFAKYLPRYVERHLIEVAPDLCQRCQKAWPDAPHGWLVVHDWHRHQRDPGSAERASEWREENAQRTRHERTKNGSRTDEERNPNAKRTLGDTAATRARATTGTGTGTESLYQENRSLSAVPARADVQALLDAGYHTVTAKQRRVLDELLDRHDVGGPEWAAALIRGAPEGTDPLTHVLAADKAWQAERRAAADAEEAAAVQSKASEADQAKAAWARINAAIGTSTTEVDFGVEPVEVTT